MTVGCTATCPECKGHYWPCSGCQKTTVPGTAPAEKVRDRLAALDAIRSNYLGYLQCRIQESDWHGCWDASVNISETECEMSGLRFALEAIGG